MVKRMLCWVLLAAVAAGMAQDAGVVREILVRGNKVVSAEAILAQMRTRVNAPFVQAELPQDEDAVLEMGFFSDVKVLSRALGGSEWQIIVEVQENPVVKEIRITGNTVFTTEELLKLVEQPIGQIYNLRNARPTGDAITEHYAKKGFFADVEIRPMADSPETLDVHVVERSVGDIYVQGLTRTNERVIRRMLKTKPNQALNEIVIDRDRRHLESTQWFEEVGMRARPTEQLGKYDLLIELKETKTAQIGLGATLVPRAGLVGYLRYFDTNFRGSGQTVGSTVAQDASGAGMSISLEYANPYYDSRDTTLSAAIYTRVVSNFTGSTLGGIEAPTSDRFDERRTGGSIALTRPFKEIFAFTSGIRIENIKTVNLRTDDSNDFIQQDGDLSLLNLAISRDTRDVPLDPAEGDFARLLLEPGYSRITKIGGNVGDVTNVLGDNFFVRANIEYKKYWSKRPPADQQPRLGRPVLAFRARYGAINGRVPFFEQLFIGGADSLRGYGEQRFWGRHSVLASLEYRRPIVKEITLAAFVDTGSAWGGYGSINRFSQSSRLDMKLGYGIGVLARTPIMPIRVDFAFNSEGGSRTHFTIGGSF